MHTIDKLVMTTITENTSRRMTPPFFVTARLVVRRSHEALAEAPDKQRVPLGAVETNHVNRRLASAGIDHLANAQDGSAAGDAQQFRNIGIRCRGIDFLVRVR